MTGEIVHGVQAHLLLDRDGALLMTSGSVEVVQGTAVFEIARYFRFSGLARPVATIVKMPDGLAFCPIISVSGPVGEDDIVTVERISIWRPPPHSPPLAAAALETA